MQTISKLDWCGEPMCGGWVESLMVKYDAKTRWNEFCVSARGQNTDTFRIDGLFVTIVPRSPATATVKLSNWYFNQFIWAHGCQLSQTHKQRTWIFLHFFFCLLLLFVLGSCCFSTAWRASVIYKRAFHEMNHSFVSWIMEKDNNRKTQCALAQEHKPGRDFASVKDN